MSRRTPALLLAALTLLGGCVSLPETGSVTTEPGQGAVDDGAGSYDYTPSGPRAGAAPLTIVEDFLLAMQASPQTTAVASRYLTDEARAGWFPQKATLVHGSKVVTGDGDTWTVGLSQTVQLDALGSWVGRVGGDRGVEYELELVKERGEWRIANPPDALIVPRDYFESRYEQYSVYYFDPSGQVLVPQPTYQPHGDQAATLLVRRLLAGPDPRLDGVLRSYIPGGTEYVLSVRLSIDGVAEVELTDRLLELGEEEREKALAQLAWTLSQVSGVDSMTVQVDKAPVDVPGAGSPQSVTSWTEYHPAVQWASQELFALRDGDPVALSSDAGEVVDVFGAREVPLRDLAVNLTGEELAGVSEDGTTVVRAPRAKPGGPPPSPEQTEVVHTGTDLLQPAWDVFDQLWLVDRSADGAQVLVVGEEVVAVEAPGLTGTDVSAFVVSRDGSRLVAVVPGRTGDRLVVSRVVRGPNGRVRGLTRAVELPLSQGGVDEIRDIAWRSPESLAVLTGPTPESSQVSLALVDGSTGLTAADTAAEILRQKAVRLVSSPAEGAPVYLATEEGQLFVLGSDGGWSEVDPPGEGPLLAPSFAG